MLMRCFKRSLSIYYKKETFQRCRYVYLLPSTMRRQQALFNINFSFLVTIVALLPLLGALTCIILSILFNFKESTWTHCRVSATLLKVYNAYSHCGPNFLFTIGHTYKKSDFLSFSLKKKV